MNFKQLDIQDTSQCMLSFYVPDFDENKKISQNYLFHQQEIQNIFENGKTITENDFLKRFHLIKLTQEEIIVLFYIAVSHHRENLFDFISTNIVKDFAEFGGIKWILENKDVIFQEDYLVRKILDAETLTIASHYELNEIADRISREGNIVVTRILLLRMISDEQYHILNQLILQKAKYIHAMDYNALQLKKRIDELQINSIVTFFEVIDIMGEMHDNISYGQIVEYIKNNGVQLNENLINSLVKNGRNQSLIHLSVTDNEQITPNILNEALKSLNFQFLMENTAIISDTLHSQNQAQSFYENFIESLLSYEGFEIKIYFLKQFMEFCQYNGALRILSIFNDSFEDVGEKCHFLLYSSNPLKLCLLVIELTRLLVASFSTLSKLGDAIVRIFTTIAEKIEESFEDENQQRSILLDKDLEDREVIYLVEQQNLLELITKPSIENLVKTFWKSKYNITGTLMETSYCNSLLFKVPFETKVDFEKKERFKVRDVKFMKNHIFQMKVWKKSMKVRYNISSFVYLILAITFQFIIMDLTDASREFISQYIVLRTSLETYGKQVKNGEITLSEENQEYIDQFCTDSGFSEKCLFAHIITHEELYKETNKLVYKAESLFNNQQFFTYSCLLFFFIYLEIIFEFIFCMKAKRPKNILNRIDLHLFFILTVATTWLFYTFEYYKGQMNDAAFLDENLNFCRNFYAEKNIIQACHSVIMALIWLLFLFSLRTNKVLGPLIKIFHVLMNDILKFLAIYILEIIVFACIGNILFLEQTPYETLDRSLLTMYRASLGNFDFDLFPQLQETSMQYIGEIYMVIVLLVNQILAINLLIAMMSATFSQLQEKSKELFMSARIKLWPLYKYSRKFSCLVSTPFPISIILVVLFPLLLIPKKQYTMNQFILHIEYGIVVIVLFLLFILMNLLILPFAYLKWTFVKLILIFRNSHEKASMKTRRAIEFGMFLFLGCLILLIQIFIDCYLFLRHLYKSKISKLYVKPKDWKLSSHGYYCLIKFLKLHLLKGTIELTYPEFVALFSKYTGYSNSSNHIMQQTESLLPKQEANFNDPLIDKVDYQSILALIKKLALTSKSGILLMNLKLISSNITFHESHKRNLLEVMEELSKAKGETMRYLKKSSSFSFPAIKEKNKHIHFLQYIDIQKNHNIIKICFQDDSKIQDSNQFSNISEQINQLFLLNKKMEEKINNLTQQNL